MVAERQRREVPFLETLVAAFPEFEPIYAEHVQDNFGEALPHLFMGQVAAWFATKLSTSLWGESKQRLVELAQFLDQAYVEGHPTVRNLLAVSFVENLIDVDDNAETVSTILGPHLRRIFREMTSSWSRQHVRSAGRAAMVT